jgi:hypothetical protein
MNRLIPQTARHDNENRSLAHRIADTNDRILAQQFSRKKRRKLTRTDRMLSYGLDLLEAEQRMNVNAALYRMLDDIVIARTPQLHLCK